MFEIAEISGKKLTVAIAADHGGYQVKDELRQLLAELGHQVLDCGPFKFDAADDYSDFGAPAARAVSIGRADAGILICRSGVGMGIVANRFHGVRAVVAGTPELAVKSRDHNASNVLVLPGDALDFPAMKEIILAWFGKPFSGDARHARRLEKVEVNSYDDIAALGVGQRIAEPVHGHDLVVMQGFLHGGTGNDGQHEHVVANQQGSQHHRHQLDGKAQVFALFLLPLPAGLHAGGVLLGLGLRRIGLLALIHWLLPGRARGSF